MMGISVPQQTPVPMGRPGKGSPPLAMMQSSPDSHMVPQLPQLLVSLATQLPEQQVSPRDPPGRPGMGGGVGAAQAGPVPQPQVPPLQLGALPPQAMPQPPQFAASLVMSTQAPPQQPWPLPQAAPPPQEQEPPAQISPSAQRTGGSPHMVGSVEVFVQRQVPPSSAAQTSPGAHWGKSPQRQLGAPLIPKGVVQALARVASQAIPQPLQLAKEESERPSVPAAAERLTQVDPQQRWAELQAGVQSPPVPPPSVGVPEQAPLRQDWPGAQAMPQPPQLAGSLVVALQEEVPPLAQHISKLPQAGEQLPLPPSGRSLLAHPTPSIRTKANAADIVAARHTQALTIYAYSPARFRGRKRPSPSP